MEAYMRELVVLVEAGHLLTDAVVLRLSRQIDDCINFIYRHSSPPAVDPAESDSISRNAASDSSSREVSFPLIM